MLLKHLDVQFTYDFRTCSLHISHALARYARCRRVCRYVLDFTKSPMSSVYVTKEQPSNAVHGMQLFCNKNLEAARCDTVQGYR